jgi:hypothetical protein
MQRRRLLLVASFLERRAYARHNFVGGVSIIDRDCGSAITERRTQKTDDYAYART